MKSRRGIIVGSFVLCGFLGALPASEIPAIAPLQPGMKWEIWQLPACDRTLPAQPQNSNKHQGSGEKSFLLRRNILGKNFRLQQIFSSDASQRSRYVTRQYVFEENPDTGEFTMHELINDEDDPTSMERFDRLQEFEWIRSEDYRGTIKVDGVECDIYMAPLLDLHRDSPLVASMQVPVRLAAIGKSDRFPRRLEGPDGVFRYTPQPKAPSPELPDKVTELMREYRQRMEKRTRRFDLPQ